MPKLKLSFTLCIGFAILSITMGACTTPQPTTIAPETSSPIASPEPIIDTNPTLTPTAAPKAAPSATASTFQLQQGQIVTGQTNDPSLSRPLPYRIYLPPGFNEAPYQRYPTLYLFHGLTYTDSQWDKLGADEVANKLIETGKTGPFIIVMPWERTGLDYEQAVINVLIPYVEKHYRGRPGSKWRALGGISRGAGWALRIGLKHPDCFSAIGLHSPAIISPDLFLIPFWVKDLPQEIHPRLWIDIGDRDTLRPSTLELVQLLDDLGWSYTFHLQPGNHIASYWSSHLEEYLTWYSSAWDE
jgi:enterochelin esterase-like enzyme